MFAIIQTDGRQIRVQEGDVLDIDLRDSGEAKGTITFDQVLLANAGAESVIGLPTIAGASVTAEVVKPLVKGEKLIIFRYKRKTRYHVKTGHRQKYNRVQIQSIVSA